MRLSLIVSTYNRPDALAAVLAGAVRQTLEPYEIIVADDGSGPDTRAVAERYVAAGLPLRHVWHEHADFRAGAIRNRAVAAATGEYLVFVDGDIFPHPDFIADHAAAARAGFFVQGSRVILSEAATKRLLTGGEPVWPGLFAAGAGNRKNLVRSSVLSRWFSGEKAALEGIRTCNFAVWRKDALKVNGFNEDFVGWGREDSEFAARLMNAGVKRRNIRFAALGCHLWHPPQARGRLADNDMLLAQAIAEKAVRCVNGVDKYLRGEV